MNLLTSNRDDVCLWDCTHHPPKDITDWPLDKYSQVQGLQSKTLFDAGWFPSGLWKVCGKKEGVPSDQINEDAQYNVMTSLESSASAQPVQLVGMNDKKLAPSQVLDSVTQRFDDDVTMQDTEDTARKERQLNAQAKKKIEQERFRKLEERIQKLEAKKSSNNKPVSEQVKKMLVKSRATGKSSLKQQDRVYFHIVIFDSGDGEESEEEFRYFSVQDTVGRGILGTFAHRNKQPELLVKQQSSSTGDDIVYRQLPNAMRVYEAIEKKLLLATEVNKVVIRWYSLQTGEEPTTSILLKDESGKKQVAESSTDQGMMPVSNVQSESNAEQPAGVVGNGDIIVDAALASLIQRKDEEEQKKSKKKASKTSAKVRQMLMKSKAKGDAKRLKKMEDRFFFELVVVHESCDISPIFLGKKDPLGRVMRDCVKGGAGENNTFQLLVPVAAGGENASFRPLDNPGMSFQEAEASKLLQPFDRLILRF